MKVARYVGVYAGYHLLLFVKLSTMWVVIGRDDLHGHIDVSAASKLTQELGTAEQP